MFRVKLERKISRKSKIILYCSFPSRNSQAEGYSQYFTVFSGQILHASMCFSPHSYFHSVHDNLETDFDKKH